MNTDNSTRLWKQLLGYYKSCISIEAESSCEFPLKSLEKTFIEVEPMEKWLPTGTIEIKVDEDNPNVTTFLRNLKGGQFRSSPTTYYYGFPSYISINNWGRASAQNSKNITPIFLFAAEVIEEKDIFQIKLLSKRPRLNSKFFERSQIFESYQTQRNAIEAIISAWGNDLDLKDNYEKILQRFRESIPADFFLKEDTAENELTLANAKDGIQQLGIIFKGGSSKYTQRLERELTKLDTNNSKPNRIWETILNRSTESHQNSDVVDNEEDIEEFLEITEMNREQRRAVASAFQNKITLVTGPPGTGKSQLVLNIIANAILHKKSVLFSSKNHKAVDVVIDKLSRIQTQPTIFKWQRREDDADFASQLYHTIHRHSDLTREEQIRDLGENKKEFKQVIADRAECKNTINKFLERRNRISQLDKELNNILDQLKPSGLTKQMEIYGDAENQSELNLKVEALSELLEEINRPLSMKNRLLGFIGRSIRKRIDNAVSELNMLLRVLGYGSFKRGIGGGQELLSIAQVYLDWVDKQAELLGIIKSNNTEVDLKSLRHEIAMLDQKLIDISRRYLDSVISDHINNNKLELAKNIGDYFAVTKRESKDRIGGDSFRELQRHKGNLFNKIKEVLPSFSVTNLSVSHIFELQKDNIDIVIIDEASQCDIVSALPLLYRAKQIVIIGDKNQLQHIATIDNLSDQEQQLDFKILEENNYRFIYDSNSLFDLVYDLPSDNMKTFKLRDHYRSHHEIIEFSNKEFYNEDLILWTDYRKLYNMNMESALQWHNVEGSVASLSGRSSYNVIEAQKVVNIIDSIIDNVKLAENKKHPTLGVVTPFRPQANKIRELLQATDPRKSEILKKMNFHCSTVHEYQGDERDIIIFSTVISDGMKAGSLKFLSATQNIFNVAITRARSSLYIVGNKNVCKNSDIKYLEAFVDYTDTLDNENLVSDSSEFESVWEEIFFDALNEAGIKSIPQYAFNKYRIDLAIPDLSLPIAIEIDGEKWHRDITNERLYEDLRRDDYFEMHGWDVKRFWVYELKNDLERCVQEVKSAVDAIEQKSAFKP